MIIELATVEQIEEISEIYSAARRYMTLQGNGNQWVDGYPSVENIKEDISLDQLYTCIDSDGDIVAVFCFFVGHDPTYDSIDGAWLSDGDYGVVHRIASSGKVRHIADYCLDWCYSKHPNIRIDTHFDNRTMQDAIKRCHYQECGTIICANGTPRVAFQKI